MKEIFKIPDNKKIRVIIDTDAACEADDPFAIAQALMSPKLVVRGILAEHFNEKGSTKRSYDEILTVLRTMKQENIPVFMGQEGSLSDDKDVSEAVRFIIDEAMRGGCSGAECKAAGETSSEGKSCDVTAPWNGKKLYILCQGAVTNVAMALRTKPEIRDRIIIIWIGTHGTKDIREFVRNADYSGNTDKIPQFVAPPVAFREYNAGNDIDAANEVLESGVELWLIPSYVYSTITVGLAELKCKVAPCGAIGRHLYENMIEYNLSERAGWTQGESWALGDSPAISVAINPGCGKYISVKAPHINADTSSSPNPDNPVIREYTYVDSRYVLEDFFAKLYLNFPPETARL